MISKIVIVGLLSVLVLSSVSMAVSGQPVNTTGEAMGNYSFTLAGNSTIKDLAYNSDGSSSMLAGNISVNGVNYVNIPSTMNLNMISTHNMTIVSMEQMHTLLVSTSSKANSEAKIVVNLTTQPVEVRNKMKIEFQSQVSNMISYQMNIQSSSEMNVFEISNGSFMGYLFTNGQTTLSNNNTTVTAVQSSSILSGKLVAGFVSNGNFRNILKNYFRNHRNQDEFTYNATTGLVSGRFVNLTFNNSTGVISNFTSRIGNNTVVFQNISSKGNGTIGTPSQVPPFRVGEPLEMGSIFFYANNSYTYAIHNNPSIESNFFLDNGTMVFNVSSGLKISEHNIPSGFHNTMNVSETFENSSVAANTTLGLNDSYLSARTSVMISGHGYFGIMSINGGNVTISGSRISVNTSGFAGITMVSPPGLQRINSSLEAVFQNSIASGKISGQIAISNDNSSSYNTSIFFNSSLRMSVTSVQDGKVTVEVGSSQHRGTNIAIFVSDKFVSNSGKIYVTFDGNSAILSSFNGTLNANSTTSAYYTTVQENSGTVVIIHIPHFSNHTIVVSSTPSVTSSPSGLTTMDYELVGGIGAVVIIGVIAGFAIRKKH